MRVRRLIAKNIDQAAPAGIVEQIDVALASLAKGQNIQFPALRTFAHHVTQSPAGKNAVSKESIGMRRKRTSQNSSPTLGKTCKSAVGASAIVSFGTMHPV